MYWVTGYLSNNLQISPLATDVREQWELIRFVSIFHGVSTHLEEHMNKLGLYLCTKAYWLCDLGQVVQPF